MAHVRLHRLFGEEESLADLAVDEAVSHELQDLDLAGGWTSSRVLGGVKGITAPRRLELRRAAAASNRRLWSR